MMMSDKTDRAETNEARRKERIPLGVPRTNMDVPDKNGFVRRWINDVGGRIERSIDAGYVFVSDQRIRVGQREGNTDTGSKISMVVGRHDNGTAMKAYLMEIKKEWYDEDQAAKQKSIDAIDDQIRHGNVDGEPGSDGRYIPDEGIKYAP